MLHLLCIFFWYIEVLQISFNNIDTMQNRAYRFYLGVTGISLFFANLFINWGKIHVNIKTYISTVVIGDSKRKAKH